MLLFFGYKTKFHFAFNHKNYVFLTDLMRQQEELKRLEEMKNEQIRRRQEMDMR